jgi:SP family sugar:H+ symporter-like MFS transporter
MGLSHFMVCLFTRLAQDDPRFSWGAAIGVYTFILTFASTWGPTVWVYQSEIFPLRIRAKGAGIATFFNWISNALIGKLTPLAMDAIGYYLYAVFGGIGITMAIFAIVFVPG